MRISRKTLLGLSVLLSLMVHAALLAASPRITMIRSGAAALDALRVFRVDLIFEDALPDNALQTRTDSSGLTSRPSSVRDLLQRESDALTPGESLLARVMDVPLLAERLAAERINREHDLLPDEEALHEVDTKLIEISQEDMRENIQMTRRLVAPSTSRILDENATPVLRGHVDIEHEETIVFSPSLAGVIEPVQVPIDNGQAAPAGGAPPPREPGVIEPLEPETTADLMQAESAMARAPVIEAVRKDSQKYEFLDDLVDIALEKYVPAGESHGYFRLRIAPKQGAAIEILPKEVTFVVDASSSITQRKLDRTVAGVIASIQKLKPDDWFNIVVFRDSPSLFRPEPIPATSQNKAEAESFLKGAEARGQTNVYEGIRPVVETPPRDGAPSIVIVASDGRPTTGMVDARNVINALTDQNSLRYSIYAFGGGNTVNRYLLDLLAYRNKGESHVSAQIDAMRDELPTFVDRLSDPILVDCTADFGGLDPSDIFPKEIPDFYRGQAVTVYGRFDPKKDREFAMRLVGKAGAREKEVVFREDLSKAATGDDRIARTWAFRRVYFLIGEICRTGERPELLAELRALSRKYQIRTVYD